MANASGLLKTAEAASRAGYSPSSFHQWRTRRLGPAFIRIGAKVFYDPKDLDAWIAAGRVEPAAVAKAEA